jgi:hypothetical protein
VAFIIRMTEEKWRGESLIDVPQHELFEVTESMFNEILRKLKESEN